MFHHTTRKFALNTFHTLTRRKPNVQINNKFHNPFNRFYSVKSKGFFSSFKSKFEEYQTVPFTKRNRFIIVKIDQEIEVSLDGGFEKWKKLYKGNILDSKHPHCVRVTKILKNLVDGLHREMNKMRSNYDYEEEYIWLRLTGRDLPPFISHLDGLNWEIFVENNPEIHGQAFPSGKVAISSGILEYFQNDAEVASFISHEVAHLVARHFAEKITKNMLLMLMNYFLNTHVFTKTLSPLVERLPFHRRLEFEADYIGLLLMASAGYDPRIALKVVEEVGRLEEEAYIAQNKIKLPDFFHTHPSERKRAKALARPKIMEEALRLYNDERVRCGLS